jgi:hypothetical protein
MKNHVMKMALNAAILVALFAAVTQNAQASAKLPDATSTSLLMSFTCAGLIAVRRFIKR